MGQARLSGGERRKASMRFLRTSARHRVAPGGDGDDLLREGETTGKLGEALQQGETHSAQIRRRPLIGRPPPQYLRW